MVLQNRDLILYGVCILRSEKLLNARGTDCALWVLYPVDRGARATSRPPAPG